MTPASIVRLKREKHGMTKFFRTVSVLGVLILCLVGSLSEGQAPRAGQARRGGGPQGPPPPRQQPARSLRVEYPPLFFREDWKLDPNAPNVNTADEPEHP